MRLLILLLLSVLTLCATSCTEKDYEEKLPPETQEGRYTFGCLVNGEIWLPEGMPLSIPKLIGRMNVLTLNNQAFFLQF